MRSFGGVPFDGCSFGPDGSESRDHQDSPVKDAPPALLATVADYSSMARQVPRLRLTRYDQDRFPAPNSGNDRVVHEGTRKLD